MKKFLLVTAFVAILTTVLCISSLAANLTIDTVSFDNQNGTGSITFTIPDTLAGKSVTLLVRATFPADATDTGIAYINQYDNVAAGAKTVSFTVRDTIAYGGILTFYVGATDVNTPYSATKLYGVLGDVNKDKTITTYDASLILQRVVGLVTFGDSEIILGNVDSSLDSETSLNTLTTFDASLILQKVVGFEIDYPIGE